MRALVIYLGVGEAFAVKSFSLQGKQKLIEGDLLVLAELVSQGIDDVGAEIYKLLHVL